MYSAERSYSTGRGVATVLELFGWVIVLIGFILALVGFSNGGSAGLLSRGFGGPTPPLGFRLLGMIPGILIIAGGLLSIMLTQQSKATLDTAEMTREMLELMRKRPAPGASISNPSSSGPIMTKQPVHDLKAGDLIKGYKGHEIRKHLDGVSVGSRTFPNVLAAERYIDGD
jgi:hypothetical protein